MKASPNTLRYPVATTALAALLLAAASSSRAANIYWDGNGTSSQTGVATAWTAVNFSSDATDTTNNASFNGAPTAADTLIFNVIGINTDQNMSLNGNRTVAGLVINSTGNVTISSHPSANTSNILTFGSGGLTINSGAGNLTTVSNSSTGFLSYRVAANQSWTNNSTNLVTMNGGISNSGNTTAYTLTLAGSSSGGITLTGPISNNGTVGTTALIINNTGGGITTLSGCNTYTGGTTVSAGVLKVNNVVALGGSAGAVSVSSGAVLDLNGRAMSNANALTLNGTGISSSGALTNTNATNATYAGLVSLGSDSSIIASTGNITLSSNLGGVITGSGFGLTVGGAKNTTITSIIGTGAGNLTKQDAGALILNGGSQSKTASVVGAGNTTIPMADTTRIVVGQTVTGTNIPGGAYVSSISANTSITISQATTGTTAASLTIAGSTYSGGTIVTGGTLQIGSSSSYSGLGTVSSGATGTGNVTLNHGTTLATSGGTGQSLYAPTITIGGDIQIGQASGGSGRVSLAGTIDLDGGSRTITVGKASASYASGQEVLRFEGVSGFAAANIIQNGALTFTTLTGNATNPSIVRSGSSSVTNFANNVALTLDDGVAYSSGTGNVFGTGTNAPALTLNAAVTRGGGVLQMGDGISGGNAVMRNAEVYSLAGGGTVSASNTTGNSTTGTLTINNGNGATFSGNITQGGTGIIAVVKTGTGTQTLSGTNSYTGGTTISDGTLEISGGNSAPGLFTMSGPSATTVLKLSNTAALATTATLAGANSAATTGTLDLAAAGSYTLGAYTGNNMKFTASSGSPTSLTFTNNSTVTSGTSGGRTLTNADANLDLVFSGTLDISSSIAGSGVTFAGSGNTTVNGAVFNGSGQSRTLDKSGAGTLTLNGDNNYQGDTTISGTGRVLINGDTTASTGAVNVSSSATLGGSGIVGGPVTLSSTASIGSAGNTLALAGSLTTTGTNILNASSTVNVAGGTTISTGSFTVDGTLGGGIAVGGAGNTLNGSGTVNGTTTVSGGTINGTLSLGTLIATGNSTISSSVSTISGTTVQSGGILNVNGSLGGGAITVDSGATLKGNGVVSGATTINGDLAPGASPGGLTFSSTLTLAGTTTMEIDGTARGVGGSYDAVDVAGLLTYGGTLTMSFGNPTSAGTTYDLFGLGGGTAGGFSAVSIGGIYAASLTNSGGTWTADDLTNLLTFTFAESTGDLTVTTYTPIPEPSGFAAMVGAGMIGFAFYRRRRHQVKHAA